MNQELLQDKQVQDIAEMYKEWWIVQPYNTDSGYKKFVEEHIAKPVYEIVAYSSPNIPGENGIYHRQPHGEYERKITGIRVSEDILKLSSVIHSVKYLETGEVFSIGDKIETTYNTTAIKPMVIAKIELNTNVAECISLCSDMGICISMSVAKKYKEPEVLFTTADGVAVTDKEQVVYILYTGSWTIASKSWNANEVIAGKIVPTYLVFSTYEAMQDYRELHKPCLSQDEVLKILSQEKTKCWKNEQPVTIDEYVEEVKCALDNYVISKLQENK